jgi:predicted permease
MKWILYFFRRRHMAREDQEELQSHIDEKIDDFVEAGMSEQAARHRARREFGNTTFFSELMQDMWRWASIDRFGQDLRQGWRQLARSPGFTLVAVLSIALGTGVNSTIFSVINAIQFRPLPYPDADRLVMIFETREQRILDWNGEPAVANVMDWKKQNHVFEDIALTDPYSEEQTLTGLDAAERVRTQAGSFNLFPLLGVVPVVGRGFDIQEFRQGGRPYILSYEFWKRRFEKSPQVLGMSLTLEGVPGTVVGVMPPGFSVFRSRDVDIWRMMDAESPGYAKRNDHWNFPIARLKPNVSLAQAQAEMNTITAALAKEYPEVNRGTGARVDTLRKVVSGGVQTLYPLMGAVGFVLLIACANVSNLLLARMATRQKEMTLRACLGASRMRLLRQLLTEALLLATLGGALGLVFTGWGIRLFRIVAPRFFSGLEVTSADPRVLLFTLAISILTGIIFGLVPAVSASKARLNEALKSAISRRRRPATSGVLVVVEVALAMLLLIGAGLMINTILRLQGVDPGLDARNVLTMEVSLQGTRYSQPVPNLLRRVNPEAPRFYQELLSRIALVGGVESVAMIGQLPTRYLEDRTFTILSSAPAEGRRPQTGFAQISPGFFQTMRIPLKRGRYLTADDNETAPWTAVINETLAQQYFPNEDPLGKSVRLRMEPSQMEEDGPRQIVGIVGDVRHRGLVSRAPAAMYASYLQEPRVYPPGRATGLLRQNIVIRTKPRSGELIGSLAQTVRNIVADLDKDQPVYRIMSMEEVLAGSFSYTQFYEQLFGIFAAMALTMAAIGIYGVISYGVTERTHEVGIRMALGAQRREIMRLIVRRGLLLALAGIAIGIAAALSLNRVIARFLFGVAPTDPLTFVVVSLLLGGVALVACYIPARKAARLDPLIALRNE